MTKQTIRWNMTTNLWECRSDGTLLATDLDCSTLMFAYPNAYVQWQSIDRWDRITGYDQLYDRPENRNL